MLFVLSSQPVLPSPPGVNDKMAHALAYGLLGVLCLVALAEGEWHGITWRRCLAAVVIAVAYGATDEFHQSFVPGRAPDLADLVADAFGAALAVAVTGASAILLRGRPVAPRV
jgi:VanZ family protein